jgi:hypothetical protein
MHRQRAGIAKTTFSYSGKPYMRKSETICGSAYFHYDDAFSYAQRAPEGQTHAAIIIVDSTVNLQRFS